MENLSGPSESAAMEYKRRLIHKLNEFQEIIHQVPADVHIPRHSIERMVSAARALINFNLPPDADPKIQRERVPWGIICDLNEAIAPFGLSVEYVA